MSETTQQQLEVQRAAIEAKLRLAQQHLDLASQLMKEAGADSVTAANDAHSAGLDVRMEDVHAIRQEAEGHTSVLEQVGYGIGRVIGLTALFFGGFVAASKVGSSRPFPRAR